MFSTSINRFVKINYLCMSVFQHTFKLQSPASLWHHHFSIVVTQSFVLIYVTTTFSGALILIVLLRFSDVFASLSLFLFASESVLVLHWKGSSCCVTIPCITNVFQYCDKINNRPILNVVMNYDICLMLFCFHITLNCCISVVIYYIPVML